MKHTLSILLQNEAGALVRVAGLFAARNCNIDSLTVAITQDPGVSQLELASRVRAAANTSWVEKPMRSKIIVTSLMKAMLMSRCEFSITLAASAALMLRATNTPPDVTAP